MSVQHISKSPATNESNIPIRKKSNNKIKRPKRCSKLPELQRYIETIIKASDEYDSEAMSERDKFPRDRKHVGNSVFKGFESKAKKDSIKNDTNETRSNIKKLISDAVSRDDKINKNFVPKFEDPRNWNLNNFHNLGPNVEVEKFLKKFFPNPYRLNIKELKNSKSEKDDARDGTLPDVVISKASLEVDRDSDIAPADNDIDPRERGIEHKNVTSDSSMEKFCKSDQNSSSKPGTTSAPYLPNPLLASKINTSRSSNSSFESLTATYKASHISSKRRKIQEFKTNNYNSSQNDYSLGKLELLNATDTEEESNGEEKTENKNLKEDKSHEAVDASSLTSMNLEEMKEIYEEITKITDSFQFVNSKQETELKKINKCLQEIIQEDAKQEAAYSKTGINFEDKPESTLDGIFIGSTIDRKSENNEENLGGVSPAEKILNELTPCSDELFETDKYVVLDMGRKEADPSPEVDEVLNFMYNCIKNFSRSKKLQKTNPDSLRDEGPKERTKNIKNDEEESTMSTSELPINQSSSTETLVGNQTKCRVEQHEFNRTDPPKQIPQAIAMPPAQIPDIPEGEPEPEERSARTAAPTVEVQNELGAYSEITEEFPTSRGATSSKFLLPLPMKMEKSTLDTCRALKNILRVEEEMLMVPEQEQERNSEEILKVENKVLIINEPSVNTVSVMGGFNNSTSNLVICINPHTQYFTSVSSIAAIPLNAPIRNEADISISSKQLEYPKLFLEKLDLPAQDIYGVPKRIYDYKQEIIITVNQSAVAYTATHVGLKAVTNHSKSTEEYSIRSSEQVLQVVIKESDAVKPKNYKNSQPVVPTESKESIESVEPERTEETKLEEGSCSVVNLLVTTSKEDVEPESLQTETEKASYRKKVHELLLRAFDLQKKLQQYLQIMTNLEQEDKIVGAVRNKIETEINLKPEYSIPLVHWHLKSSVSEQKTTADKPLLLLTVDSGTTYDPPIRNTCEQSIGTENQEPEITNTENKNDDDDDRSSNNSFKSSNDMSESSENPVTKKEGGIKKRLMKKIFNEIESYRQSYTGKSTGDQKAEDSKEKSLKWLSDSQLVHYEPKTPAKVLKTVFKGKKSSTELTIGLKDVPMTKVGNISVEKTKFSPNHTKISICISRENAIDSHKNFSSYVFDRMRPSLSTCLTDYSKLNDEMSKCSQSLIEESEDDDEDYKSVGSTLGDSDGEEKKSELKDKPVEVSPPSKGFTKHRFDFYRKMNLDSESSKSKNNLFNSMSRYKELEPLRQALTEMQIRMRRIKRDSGYSSCDYYERALKLAKMSAGFCQNCGNRAVIPNDTFGYYRTLVPQKTMQSRRIHNLRSTITPKPSYYSFRSSNAELNHPFCDVNIKQSSCSLHPTVHSNRTILRSSLHDMPILFEGM